GSSSAATVRSAGFTWTTPSLGVAGILTVTDGGTINTQSLGGSVDTFFGNGTINASGAILDANIIFDATHGANQSTTVPFGSGGVINLTSNGFGLLAVGDRGVGTLRIADGRQINCANGYLGYFAGSQGTATVSGAGTQWTSS